MSRKKRFFVGEIKKKRKMEKSVVPSNSTIVAEQ